MKIGDRVEVETPAGWVSGVVEAELVPETDRGEDFHRLVVRTDDGRLYRGCDPLHVRAVSGYDRSRYNRDWHRKHKAQGGLSDRMLDALHVLAAERTLTYGELLARTENPHVLATLEALQKRKLVQGEGGYAQLSSRWSITDVGAERVNRVEAA